MRTIKFRGRTVNGDWVYGDLRHDREGSTKYFEQCPYRICWSDGTADCNAPVVKGTVGQYTGLQDKNGKEIYEGDIVEDGDEHLYVAFENGCFGLKFCQPNSLTKRKYFDSCINWDMCEVVSSIYESPHLLEQPI